MANEIAVIQPMDVGKVTDLGQLLAKSGYFSDAKETAQAAVKVMAGQELGIPPIAAMMGIHIISGKVALGAHLIASRVKAHGYRLDVKFDGDSGCTITFRTSDGAEIGKSSFGEADAKKADVFNHMYKKFPRNMYYSRALSNGAKWYTPEVFGGAPVYTPEELGAKVDGDGEIIAETAAPPNTRAAQEEVGQRKIAEMQRQQAAAPPTTPPQAAAPPPAAPAAAPVEKSSQWKNPKTFEEFAALKARVGEEHYYRGLAAYGVKHSNEFKNAKDARDCFKELLAIAQQIEKEAAAAPPPVQEQAPAEGAWFQQ